MNLIKRNSTPFDDMAREFFGEERLFDNFSFNPIKTLVGRSNNIGRVNIIDDDKEYVIQVSVPGFKKDDIKIDLENDILMISSTYNSKVEESNNYYRKEFVKSSFNRSFYIPDDADISNIDAKMEDGILNVVIFKKEIEKENKISINVK